MPEQVDDPTAAAAAREAHNSGTKYATYKPPPAEQDPLERLLPGRPTLKERFTIFGLLAVLIPLLRAMLAEQKEANRLRKEYYRVQGVARADLMTDEEQKRLLHKQKVDGAWVDADIEQPTNDHYVAVEAKREALRARGIVVPDDADPELLEYFEQGGEAQP